MTIHIVLFIVVSAVVLNSFAFFVFAMSKQVDRLVEKQKIDSISNAVRQFALCNGRLPYPAVLIDGKTDGIEAAHPKDEIAWRDGVCVTYGALPYITLGIAKENALLKNKYIEYVVNPMLCGRKDVKHISPNDPRLDLDRRKHNRMCLEINNDDSIIRHIRACPDDGLTGRIHVPAVKYSSISCVHGYVLPARSDTYNRQMTCGDIATYLKDKVPKIILPNGRAYEPQILKYRVYDATIRGANVYQDTSDRYYETVCGQILIFALDAEKADQADTQTTRIENMFAFAIAASGAITKTSNAEYKITQLPYIVISRADILGNALCDRYNTLI